MHGLEHLVHGFVDSMHRKPDRSHRSRPRAPVPFADRLIEPAARSASVIMGKTALTTRDSARCNVPHHGNAQNVNWARAPV